MDKLLLIYPADPSIDFLSPVEKLLEEVYGENLIVLKPSVNGNPSNKEIPERYDEFKSIETVIFMGHGSRTSLIGGADDEDQRQELFNFKNASRFLSGKNFICISCYSVNFVYGLEGLRSSISFGNLPTTWKDVIDARSISKNAYENYTENSIDIYRVELIKAIVKGLKISLTSPISLRNLYYYIRLYINKAISKLVVKDLDHQLAARQLYVLKIQMNLID